MEFLKNAMHVHNVLHVNLTLMTSECHYLKSESKTYTVSRSRFKSIIQILFL